MYDQVEFTQADIDAIERVKELYVKLREYGKAADMVALRKVIIRKHAERCTDEILRNALDL